MNFNLKRATSEFWSEFWSEFGNAKKMKNVEINYEITK